MITTTKNSIKQRVFKDYQRMLSFTINLCYRGLDYSVMVDESGYTVRYQ